jgi:hypothetical protein
MHYPVEFSHEMEQYQNHIPRLTQYPSFAPQSVFTQERTRSFSNGFRKYIGQAPEGWMTTLKPTPVRGNGFRKIVTDFGNESVTPLSPDCDQVTTYRTICTS